MLDLAISSAVNFQIGVKASESSTVNGERGIQYLGTVSSGCGVELMVYREDEQYDADVITDVAQVTSLSGNPAHAIAKWDGKPFRPIPSLNFVPSGASIVARTSGPVTVSACIFNQNFLNGLAETECDLQLNDFDILAGIESARLAQYCQTVFREALAPGFASSLFAEAIGTAIALEVARYHRGLQHDDRQFRGGLAPRQLKRLESHIHANLAGELSLGELARLLGMSVRHLSHSVRKAKSMSTHQWISQVRFLEARRLLAQTNLPVGIVAQRTGFRSAAAFSRAFHAASGYTPTEFRSLCKS